MRIRRKGKEGEEDEEKKKRIEEEDEEKMKKKKNKAGYTAAEVACGWAGAVRVGRGRILGH